jgi:hypothetical protein
MENKNAAQPTKVITGKCRFSYLNAFTPKTDDDGDEKYGVCLLIPKKDKETLRKIEAAVDAAIEIGKGKLGDAKGKVNKKTLKLPLRDGDEERPDDEAYEGMMFMNANSKQKPGLVDVDRQPIIDSTELYSGCWGRASVNFFAFDGKQKGIACGLNNLQKLSDDAPLGGRSNAEDDFSEEYDEDDDDMLK